MRLSNKLTFSLASLIVLFAFATVPVMANTMSADWSDDLNGDGTVGDRGWKVTVTYATAPAATVTSITATASNAASPTVDPAAGDGTETEFTFNVQLNVGSEALNSDVTISDNASPAFASRRVTLINGQDLASISIYQPKLKSIMAPKSARQLDDNGHQVYVDVIIEFEAPVYADAIGPAIGLKIGDVATTDGSVESVTPDGANKYKAVIRIGTASATISVTTSAFPFQERVAGDPAIEGANDIIVFDNLDPVIPDDPGIVLESTTEFDLPAYPAEIDDNFRVVIAKATDTPAEASTFDLEYAVTTSMPNRAVAKYLGTKGGNPVFEVELLPNETDADWPVADIRITVTVTDIAGNSTEDDTNKVKLAARAAGDDGDDDDDEMMDPDEGPTVSPVFTIPGKSFIVVVRDDDETASGAAGLPKGDGDHLKDVMLEEWSQMPNLRTLFSRSSPGGGGAIALRQSVDQPDDKQLAVGTVGISEIMWAIDVAYIGKDGEDASQWIELHNLNEDEAMVYLTTATGTDITDDQTLIGGSEKEDGSIDPDGGALVAPTIDVVTNFFDNRPGNAAWDLPGDNGSSKSGIDFISMARVLPHDDGFDVDAKNDDGNYIRRFNNKDGRAKGNWTDADDYTPAYIRTDTANPDSATTHVPSEYEYRGTPGNVNKFKPAVQPHTKDTRTNVPASPVIINEVANRSNADYEWIELRNVTMTKQNLRNMLISVVTSNSSDVPLIQMPNDDKAQIEPEGVFLLVASDPRDKPEHPLAVGWDVDKAEEDQMDGLGAIGINATSKHGRYRVVDFENGGLPDGDGQKFVLILRSKDGDHGNRSGGNDGEGVAETGAKDVDKIIDIAGYDDDLSKVDYSNVVSKTDLWPLKAFEGPASNNNRFLLDRVVRRQHVSADAGKTGVGTTHGDKKPGQVAFGTINYSGVGYKRQASKSNAHGGTPGYYGVEKGDVAAIGDKLYISELMLSQGTGRVELPQWIEIYNPSDYAVQLDAGDGWRLIIENPGRDQDIRTINFKSKGDVKRVLPNETILVVSYRSRADIGHDRLPDTTAFPDTRVFDVFEELKVEFDMDNRSTPILNPKAFRMTLIDGKANDTSAGDGTDLKVGNKYYAISDDVGNLDGNIRTNDEGDWEYPEGMDPEDGSRSSLIRVFDDRVAREGVSMDESNVLPIHAKQVDAMVDLGNVDGAIIPDDYSWVQAFQVEFGRIRNRTWFGDVDDDGSPATRISQILPVSLSHFRPALENGEVVIRWTTESELDNAGFNILRSDTRNGEFKQVNAEMIQGNGTTGERNTYKWVDATAKPGVVYYYQIEDVSFAGERETLQTTKLKGYISAVGKATTTWGDIKEVQ